jgi:hypothetical protein
VSAEVPIDRHARALSNACRTPSLQDIIEALKREIIRMPRANQYRKALKDTGERLTIAKQILAREGNIALTIKAPTQSPNQIMFRSV